MLIVQWKSPDCAYGVRRVVLRICLFYSSFHFNKKMAQLEYKDLLDAGVHFGHLTRKWDPRMAPYIFMEKNGIHIIDRSEERRVGKECRYRW